MEVIKIKGNYKINPIISKLRVAAYVRVSTKLDMQLTSFESQKKYFENKIQQNEKWTLVEIYSDYGASGSNTNVRTNFMRMIRDAYNGKIDLILTKSISRFARNTVDTLKYVRELKTKGIGVYFEEEGIYTLNNSTELLLTVLSSVAQQESENISAHVKLGKEMKMLEGKTTQSRRPYGYNYNKKTKKYTINKYESKVIIEIFNKFLETKSLAKTIIYITEKNYKKCNRQNEWDKSTVSTILRNQRYIGIMATKKSIHPKIGSQMRRKNTGIENRYLIYDFNPKIIDEETFNKVQKILDKNIRPMKPIKTHDNEIRCGFCGGAVGIYKHYIESETLMCYNCCSKKKGSCSKSKTSKTQDIKEILIECLTKYLKEYIQKDRKVNIKSKSQIKEKEIIVRRKGVNVDLLLDKKINKGSYIEKNRIMNQRIHSINKDMDDYRCVMEKQNERKALEKDFYNFIVDKMNTKLSLFALLEELGLILIVGGYDEKNHAKPYMIRFVKFNTFRSFNRYEKIELFKKLTLNNEKEYLYNVLLDYKSKYIRKVKKEMPDRVRVVNKTVRVRLEIVEER